MPGRDAEMLARQQRALLDSLPDVAWLKNTKGQFIAVNRAFCARYNLTHDTAVGKTDFDIYSRDKAAQIRQDDAEVMASLTPTRYESSRVIDGHRYWVEIIKAPILDDAGKVIGTVGTSRDTTARKSAEASLQKSEHRFRSLAELSSDWYWELDKDFRFVSISSRPAIGLNFSGVIGKTPWELPTADVTEEQWSAHRLTLQAHLPVNDFQYTLIMPDGKHRQLSVSGRPIYDESGHLAGYIGAGRDITERVTAQQELHFAKQRLELALEGSRVILWDVNIKTGEAYLSEGWATLLGKPASQTRTTAAELATLVHADDLPEVQRRSVQTIQGKRDEYAVEHRVRAADNTWKWIMSRGRVTARSADGWALRMSGTNLDITERKAMETSLGQALRQSDALLETTPTALAVVRRHVILRCNPAMEHLFGAARDQLIAQPTRILFASGEAWSEAAKQIDEVVARGDTFRGEFEFARLDGTPVWASVAGRLVEPGSPDAVFAYTDTTAQQNLARALAAAKQAADAANRAKSGFLAAMSHEIRTPMNGVLGMLELLELSSLDNEQRVTLSLARDSAVALLRLIDDILDFSKIEAGQLQISREPVSLATLASRSAAVYLELAARKGLPLECRVDTRIAPAHVADGLRVSQILNNLLSNAIKFTLRGKVALEIDSLERTDQDEQVRVRVSDTGIGIPAAQQGRLFQPFVQADSNTTRQYGGSGLGLSICRQLAEMMGGKITLESQPGVGTTITVLLRLPIADPDAIVSRETDRLEQLAAVSKQAPVAPRADAPRILIAEDHPVNLVLIERQVSMLGYLTELTRDGTEALAKWKTGTYALLLTDCYMPHMDGYQLAREIRRIEAARDTAEPIPIVACTANALASDAELCFEAGMSDFLAKPITLLALKATLEKWVDAAPKDAPVGAGAIALQPAVSAQSAVPPAAAAQGPPLDAGTLGEYTGGDEAMKREILRRFLAANQVDAIELRKALAAKNSDAAAKMAHRLKGASRMIGATPFAAVVERIERAAGAGNRAATQACVEDFEREQSRLTAFLRSEIGHD